MEALAAENEKLKNESQEKDRILQEYADKLTETSRLLKVSSATNKKLQKKLNVKKCCKEVLFSLK